MDNKIGATLIAGKELEQHYQVMMGSLEVVHFLDNLLSHPSVFPVNYCALVHCVNGLLTYVLFAWALKI